MSEKELNEQYIKNKIQGICQDCMWFDKTIPIINKMLSEAYISGFEQGKFDLKMDLQQKVEQLEKENDKLKHKLNDIAFGDDSELALRFLRKIDYVDFDEKRKVYINKHNNEPFILKDEQEKDYYLKDEELNEYTQQLEYKVEQLENIRKEAIEYINNNNHIDGCLIKWEVADLLNILNKGGEE